MIMTSVFIISPISWDHVIVIGLKVLPAYIRRTVKGRKHEQKLLKTEVTENFSWVDRTCGSKSDTNSDTY